MNRIAKCDSGVAVPLGIAVLVTACATPLGPDEVEVQHTRMGYSCKTSAQRAKIDAGWFNLKAGMTVLEVEQHIGLPFSPIDATASAISAGAPFELDYCGIFLKFRNGQLSNSPNKPIDGWGSDYQQTWTMREKKPQ